jgi:hypothetical protein
LQNEGKFSIFLFNTKVFKLGSFYCYLAIHENVYNVNSPPLSTRVEIYISFNWILESGREKFLYFFSLVFAARRNLLKYIFFLLYSSKINYQVFMRKTQMPLNLFWRVSKSCFISWKKNFSIKLGGDENLHEFSQFFLPL